MPPTGLDSGIPPTGLDAQLPRTGLDADGLAEAAQDSIHRFDLPAKLRETHQLLGPLVTDDPRSAGGEAALSRVRENASGATQVYKIYFQASTRDEEVWARLREADREDIHGHVVDIYDYGTSSGLWWELMEYCELGSLSDAPPIFENPFRDEFRRRAPAIMETLSRIQQMPSDTTTQVKEKDRLLRTHFRPLSEAFRSVADLWCSFFFHTGTNR